MTTYWKKMCVELIDHVSMIAVMRRLPKKKDGFETLHLLALSIRVSNVLKLFFASLIFRISNRRRMSVCKKIGMMIEVANIRKETMISV